MNKLKKILACMIITLGILYLPEIHANASTVTIDEATFPDSCVRKFAQEQDVNKDGVLSDEERNIVDYALWDWYTAAAYGVDGSHLIDFTGMQNFPKITKVRLQLGCKVNGKEIYWNYKASNLFQCFPHVKQLSIVSFGTKSIELSGESNTLEALDISFENEILKTGEVVCKMYAPNIKEIDITGNISTKSYSLGKCFPKAKYIYLYDTNVGKSGTLDGFQDIETLFISGKKVTDMNLSFLSGITIHRLEIEKTKISKLDMAPLRKTKLNVLDIDNCPIKKLMLLPLKNTGIVSLSISNCYITSLNLKEVSNKTLTTLSIINCPLKKLDVSPLKNTLETLYVGDRQQFYTKYREVYKKTKFTTLDLSMMKKLKEVYGSGAGSIKTVRLKNPKKHVRVKTLQELHLYGTKIKSIDVSGLTKLKKLYVGNCTTKCNINKCTKLEELGIINRGTTDLSLKSKSLKHLQYRGGKVKKLSVKKCPKLYAVTIRGTKAKSLDFKGNKNLLYLSIYNSNIGKVVYPKVKKADWRYEYKIQDKRFSSDPITNAEESGIFTYEHYLGGYNINQVKTVDISAWKRLSSAMKKRQLSNGYKFVMKQYTPRRIIINKKLRSSDKKWIRAVAKKIKAKVIMW